MARRSGASARDIAEFASGRASGGDKREMGFQKRGGRLKPGRRTPRKVRSAFARAVKRGHGGPTKVRRKRGRRR